MDERKGKTEDLTIVTHNGKKVYVFKNIPSDLMDRVRLSEYEYGGMYGGMAVDEKTNELKISLRNQKDFGYEKQTCRVRIPAHEVYEGKEAEKYQERTKTKK